VYFLKCIVLVTNFQKSPSAGVRSLEVARFGQIVFYQTDYDKFKH